MPFMRCVSAKTVLLNLGSMSAEEAQRSADFVAGGVYALNGHQERLSELVFPVRSVRSDDQPR